VSWERRPFRDVHESTENMHYGCFHRGKWRLSADGVNGTEPLEGGKGHVMGEQQECGPLPHSI
jgi:hypothetical protein